MNKLGKDFSLTRKINDYIMNYDWRAGIDDVIQNRLPRDAHNKVILKDCPYNAALWYMLSATYEDMTSDIFEKIRNMIANNQDPETCSIDALISIAEMMNVKNYKIFQVDYPLEIKDFIDVYSISRSKLVLEDAVLLSADVKDIKDSCSVGVPTAMSGYDTASDIWSNELSANIQSIQTNGTTKISDELYLSYLENQLSTIILDNLTADGILTDFNTLIYTDHIYTSETILDTPADTQDIIDLKKKYGISSSFSVKEECDKVIRGESKITDYTSVQKQLMDVEIQNRRELDKFGNDLTKFRRYRYDRERKVRDYIRFLEKISISNQNLTLTSGTYYDEISGNNLHFFDRVDGVSLSGEMIDNAVKFLRNVCINTSYLRENLRTMYQKYKMIGTGNILQLLINEYISKEFTNPDEMRLNVFTELSAIDPVARLYDEGFYKTLTGNLYGNIKIVEYYDGTEYYNISADNETASQYNSVNPKYWTGDENYISQSTSEHTENDIQNFYKNIEDFKEIPYSLISAYITSLYEYGALSAMVPNSLTDTTLTSVTEWDSNASLSGLYLKYLGEPSGNLTWYNDKNTVHPSIAILPYLWNLRSESIKFSSLQNIYNYIPKTSSEIESMLSSMYDDNGIPINLWKKDNLIWTAYRDQYEYSNNLNKNYIEDERSDYDGPFYYAALSAYLNYDNAEDFITNEFSNWYGHLYLSEEEKTKIQWQLVQHQSEIQSLFNKKIYQFCVDKYGNQYTLYKSDNQFDTSGVLWMKYKNHPFSFPVAITNADKYTQIDADTYLFHQLKFEEIANNCYDFGVTILADNNILWMVGNHNKQSEILYCNVIKNFNKNVTSYYANRLKNNSYLTNLGDRNETYIGTYATQGEMNRIFVIVSILNKKSVNDQFNYTIKFRVYDPDNGWMEINKNITIHYDLIDESYNPFKLSKTNNQLTIIAETKNGIRDLSSYIKFKNPVAELNPNKNIIPEIYENGLTMISMNINNNSNFPDQLLSKYSLVLGTASYYPLMANEGYSNGNLDWNLAYDYDDNDKGYTKLEYFGDSTSNVSAAFIYDQFSGVIENTNGTEYLRLHCFNGNSFNKTITFTTIDQIEEYMINTNVSAKIKYNGPNNHKFKIEII